MTDSEQESLETLGEYLKQLRVAKGYSQEILAEKTDLDRTYISGLERGKRNPSYLTIMRLANALDVTEGTLFTMGESE